jgi:hypothetical protein
MSEVDRNLDDVEQLVDRMRLEGVVEALIQVCHAKAEHLRTNWQDKNAADSWERDAKKLGRPRLEN